MTAEVGARHCLDWIISCVQVQLELCACLRRLITFFFSAVGSPGGECHSSRRLNLILQWSQPRRAREILEGSGIRPQGLDALTGGELHNHRPRRSPARLGWQQSYDANQPCCHDDPINLGQTQADHAEACCGSSPERQDPTTLGSLGSLPKDINHPSRLLCRRKGCVNARSQTSLLMTSWTGIESNCHFSTQER